MIDLLGFGIVLPLLPFYAGNFGATPVQIGLLYSIYSFAQLVFSPIWGGLSDRVGRRPIMLLSTFGGMLAYVWFGLAGSLAALFLSRLMAGVMGGNLGAAQAYIADVTTAEKRASGMALIGAAFGIGFVLGPAIATGLIHPSFADFFTGLGWTQVGDLLREYRFEATGFFAAAMSLGSFLMVWFFLPETVDTSNATQVDRPRRPSPLSATFWRNLARSEGILNTRAFRLLIVSGFLLSFLQSTLFGAFPLYCEQVFGMSAEEVGIQFFYVGLITIVIQGGFIRVLTRYFKEEHLFVVGNLFTVAGFMLIGFASAVVMMTVWLALMSVGMSLNGPTIASLISKQVDPSQTGALLGTYQSISGMGRVVGPTWGGFLFVFAPSLPFWLTGCIVMFTVYAGLRLR